MVTSQVRMVDQLPSCHAELFEQVNNVLLKTGSVDFGLQKSQNHFAFSSWAAIYHDARLSCSRVERPHWFGWYRAHQFDLAFRKQFGFVQSVRKRSAHSQFFFSPD